ncbi:MAG TPA: carbohydrate ABC transporter permease [Gemmatimonadales bacterium]|nr:carbohydrate ABC transporter permease [Gemmatimonadales bacterium]
MRERGARGAGRRSRRSAPSGLGWLGSALGVVAAAAMLAPFLYMVLGALQDPGSFRAALTGLPFGRFFLNSALVTLSVVAGQVTTSAMAAYAFARLRFPGRDRVFLGYLSLLLVPSIALVVPRFLLIRALGWVDTYQGLITTELVSVWGIFLLRQFFQTIPRDLEDAARLEGASEWTIFWRIVLPLSQPGLAAVAVLALVDQWKSFLWPLVATQSTDMRVLEVGLANVHGLYATNWPYQMAAATVVMAPLLALYAVAQNYLQRAVELSLPS